MTVEYRNRIDDLKEIVDGLDLNQGNKNALTVKLSNTENMLNAFINQVNAFRNAGKLTEEQAVEMIDAAEETIRNITK